MKAFLKLPSKFRTYPELDDTEINVQVEVTAAKQRISASLEGEVRLGGRGWVRETQW